MAFLNFVSLCATAVGDSNELQEPARMPGVGTEPHPTSGMEGFGSRIDSFSPPLSACVSHGMPSYHNTVTLFYYPPQMPC